MMSVMCLPIASSAVQPKMRVAEGFHDRMVPRSDLLMMASSDDSTIAAIHAAERALEISKLSGSVMNSWRMGGGRRGPAVKQEQDPLPRHGIGLSRAIYHAVAQSLTKSDTTRHTAPSGH